uniref:NB-ARC domain-containing protein n=1 Tax=Brassica oleracea var. oleracea TaxID=109376 RepID=A0A0D3BDA9_BRAOL
MSLKRLVKSLLSHCLSIISFFRRTPLPPEESELIQDRRIVMAEEFVSSGVQKLLGVVNRETKRLRGVHEQVADLICQKRALQSFLEDADAKKYGSERLRNLLEDVKDVIEDAEATEDSYLLKERSGEEKGIMTCVKRHSCFLFNRRKFATHIEGINKRISKLIARMCDFGIHQIIDGNCSVSSHERQRLQRETQQTFPGSSENNLVGVEQSVKTLVGHLVDNNDNIQVVSISGMGGIEFTQKDIWQRVLQDLRPHDGDVKQMDEGTLQGKLCQLLETSRYLIVLDDVWKDEAWDRIKAAFPLKRGGSKVILTSRNEGVGSHADPTCFPFRPRTLTLEESWQLCKSIVFPKQDATEFVVDEELEAMGKKMMLTHCGGLPLAVKVLGGLLAKKPTVSEWEKVCDQVARESGLDDKKLSSVYRVLCLSYEDLPMHLKHCFLYLAHFPEDYKIDLEKLFLCWAAAGIIKSFHDGDTTIRESGEDYLEELVTRNIVIVVKSNSSWETHFPKDYKMDVEELFTNWGAEGIIKSVWNGATIQESKEDYLEDLVRRNMVTIVNSYSSWGSGYCQMHDIMREVCLLKSKEENFVDFINSHTSTTTINAHIPSRSRRLVVHGGSALHMLGRKKNKRVRSILCFGAEGNLWKQSSRGFRSLPLLRMLDLNGAKFKGGELPSSIGKLIHLRFLSLRGACVSKLPHSLGNLKFLLYLNLCVNQVVHVPNVLKEMLELRYLLLPAFMDDKTKLELAALVKLETLWYFPTKNISVTDLLCMTRLRTLRVYLNGGCTSETLSSSLRGLSKLEQFTLVASDKSHVYNGGDFTRDCNRLKSLTLVMHMPRSLEQDQFPPLLAHICLQYCRMEEDPMPVLEKLLHLESVDLSDSCFVGRRMVCSESGFPRLCALQISKQEELEEWIVEEGSVPCLRTLTIEKCEKLKELPDGLKYITCLKELKIQRMNKEWTKKLEPGGEHYCRAQHIPDVQFINCIGE